MVIKKRRQKRIDLKGELQHRVVCAVKIAKAHGDELGLWKEGSNFTDVVARVASVLIKDFIWNNYRRRRK